MSFEEMFGGNGKLEATVERPVVYGSFCCQFLGCNYESEEAEYDAIKKVLLWDCPEHGESSCKFNM